jgi:hypothetical protein
MSHRSISESITDDLLASLIGEDNSAYPWDLSEASAEGNFREQERAFSLLDCLEAEELVDRANTFFANLQQCWHEAESPSVQPSSFAQFTVLLPEAYLTHLIERAKTLVNRQIEGLDQLVACISPLFPRWSAEDLQVFARPYAYAMRDERATKPLETRNWQMLSEVEKIRLSVAIASEILQELSSNT